MHYFYSGLSGYVDSFKWASRTGVTLYGETGFTKFIARAGSFLWWLSYIVASFLFTYTVRGWSFLNFNLDFVMNIASMVSIVAFLCLIIGMAIYENLWSKQTNKKHKVLGVKTIFSFLFGTLVSILFTLIMSYTISLSSSLMLIAVMLGLQVLFFLCMVLDLFLGRSLKHKYTGKISEEDSSLKEKQRSRVNSALVIIVEILMLGFVVYFGVIPYFQSGGLEAIKDKMSSTFNGTDTITLLFGSKGIIVAGVTVLGIIVSTIAKIVKKR